MRTGHNRKPRPVSGIEREIIMDKMDTELDIVETSSMSKLVNKAVGTAVGRDRNSLSKNSTISKHNSAVLNSFSGSRAYPVVPNATVDNYTSGVSMTHGRPHFRHIVSPSPTSGKKTIDKYGISNDQRTHSPSSEDEAYYISSWSGAKNDKNNNIMKKSFISHPSSAPSRKIAQSSQVSRVSDVTAWPPSGLPHSVIHGKNRGKPGSSVNNARSDAVSGSRLHQASVRSRSSSLEVDGINTASVHGNYLLKFFVK